jgi:lipopolysaccharide transport system permease protein
MLEDLRELMRFREMLKNLAIKELRVRYKESALGFLWSLFTPLLNMAIYTVIFSVVMKSVKMEHYSIFLLAGIFPWTFFQTSVGSGCVSVVNNGSLVKKVYFPTEILPLSIVFSNFVNFMLSLVVFFLFMLVYRMGLHLALIALPLIFLVQIAFTIGISLLVAVATVYFRDIEHFLGVFLFALFYATPIIFPVDNIPAEYQIFYKLNPLTPLINAYQNVLYYGKFPDWTSFGIISVISVLVMVLGYSVFSKFKGMLPEEV